MTPLQTESQIRPPPAHGQEKAMQETQIPVRSLTLEASGSSDHPEVTITTATGIKSVCSITVSGLYNSKHRGAEDGDR